MTQDLKTKLIEEAQERFDKLTKDEVGFLTKKGLGCCGGDLCEEDHNQRIKDFLATEIGNAVEACKKAIEPTFRGCACGLHGYQVLPDCDEEKHDLKSCADCALSTITQSKDKDQ